MPQKLLLTLLFPLLTLALWAQPDRIGGKIDYATQRRTRPNRSRAGNLA